MRREDSREVAALPSAGSMAGNLSRLPTVSDYEELTTLVLRHIGFRAVHVQSAHEAAISHFTSWASREGFSVGFSRNPRSEHDTEGGRVMSSAVAMWHGVVAAVNLHIAGHAAAFVGLSASMWSVLAMLALPLDSHTKCMATPLHALLKKRGGMVYKTAASTRDERLLEYECPCARRSGGRTRPQLLFLSTFQVVDGRPFFIVWPPCASAAAAAVPSLYADCPGGMYGADRNRGASNPILCHQRWLRDAGPCSCRAS